MGSSTRSPTPGRLRPMGKVVCALDPAAVAAVSTALEGAGIDPIRLEVLTAGDAEGLSAPLDRTGLLGVMGRLLLSLGDDLDELERARDELAAGHVILAVPVVGTDGKHRARDILRDHGGHSIRYFGHWTVSALH